MILLSDGKILAVGYVYDGSTWDLGMTRYNSDGSLDTAFGSNGKTTYDFDYSGGGGSTPEFPATSASNAKRKMGVAVDEDGKILITGPQGLDFPNMSVFRFLSDGSIDSDFADGGRSSTKTADSTEFRSVGTAKSIVIQSDGKIVIGGEQGANTERDFCMARFLP